MNLTIFGKEQLEAAVTKLLPQLPEGHTSAVGLAVDNEGVKLAFTVHMDELGGWDGLGYGQHGWDGTNVAGAELIHSW